MNSRDRIITALECGQPDRVPTWDWFDEPVMLGVSEILGLERHRDVTTFRKGDDSKESVELYCRVVKALDVDGTSNAYSTGLEVISGDFARDRYGRTFLLSEHGEPAVWESETKTVADLNNYDMASRIEDKDFDSVRHVIGQLPDRAHALNVKGPFQEAWLLLGGMDKLMLAIGNDPELVHATFRQVTDFTKVLMDISADIGVDFIVLDGDLCGNDHTLISYEHFREFVFPYKKELVEYCHGLRMRIIKHSDGMVWRLIDDFIELGFDGFHPVQPQCMDLAQTKAYLHGRMCVFGNVDCLDLLVFGQPDDVEQAVKKCIAAGSPGGGHVLSSSNSLHPGCKPENVIAMFDAVKKHGDYADISSIPVYAPPPPDVKPVRARRVNRRRVRQGA